jgi:hypothetical protein
MSTFEDFMIAGAVDKNKEIYELRQKLLLKEKELAEANEKIARLSPPNLELLPPPVDARSRFSQFKELLFKCYDYLNKAIYPWDASDATQLSKFLKSNPTLTIEEFRNWLLNYSDSGNINPSWRIRRVLSVITEYRNGPLNEYGRPLVEKKRRVL